MRTESVFIKLKQAACFFVILVYLLVVQSSVIGPQSFAKVERLVVVGSTTMLPLSEQLATKYRGEVGVDVLVQGGGSTAGINAVLNGIANVGASSRELSKKEKEHLNAYIVGRDALAIVVNKKNPINNISLNDLRKVLSGEINTWEKLGTHLNKPIQIINDSAGSGTRAAIEELVMKDSNITLMSVVVNSSAEMKGNVTNLKHSIGYLPLNYLDNTVKALSINNVLPSYAAAYKGDYPLFRDLYYVIKKDSKDLGLAYIYYVLSPEGQDVVVKEGFLPVKLITSIEELDRISKGETN